MKNRIQQRFSLQAFLWLFAVAFFTAVVAEAQVPELTVQLSHSVRAMATFPNQPYVVSVGDNSVIIWDTEEQKLLRSWVGHNDKILTVAVNSDGSQIATGSADRTIKLWSPEGKLIRTIRGPRAAVYGVSFSPGGSELLVAMADGAVFLVDVAQGRPIHQFEGHRGGAYAAAISPDGKYGLSGGNDGIVRIWDLAGGSEVKSFRGHFESVISVAWHPDSKRFASGGTDQIVRLWSLDGETPLRTFDGHKQTIECVAFSNGGTLLASSGGRTEGEVFLWNTEGGGQEGYLRGHEFIVYAVAFTQDDVLFSGGFDATIRAWDTAPAALRYILKGVAEPIYDIAFARNAPRIALMTNGRVIVRDAENGRRLSERDLQGSAIDLSPNGRYLAVGTFDGQVLILDAMTAEVLHTFKEHAARVLDIRFGTNSNLVYSAGADGALQNYSIQSGKKVRTFQTGGPSLVALAVNPQGGIVASAGEDGKLYIFSNASAKQLSAVGLPAGGRSVEISRDGKTMAVGCENGLILLYDAAEGKLLGELKGHSDPVTTLSFSADSKTLASACGDLSSFRDQSIRIWDIATRSEKAEAIGHKSRVYAVAYSPNGGVLASGSEDSQFKLWETASYKELLTMAVFPQSRDYVMVSPDGYFYGTDTGLQKGIYYVQGSEILTLTRFFDKYYMPQLWEARVNGKPLTLAAPKPVEEVDPKPEVAPETTDTPVDLPPDAPDPNVDVIVPSGPAPDAPKPVDTPFKPTPTVAITNPQNGQVFLNKDEIKVAVEATDMGGGVSEIRLFINGKAYRPEERGLATTNYTIGKTTSQIFPIKLLPGLNELKAVAYNEDNIESEPATIYVQLQGPEPRASLFVLAIGLNKYKNDQYNLNYGTPDASAIAKGMGVAGEGVFDKVVVTELYDEQATRANVDKALNDFIVRAKPEDVFVFFYAGHGVMGYRTPQEGDFFLVLHNVTKMFGNDQLLNAEGLSATLMKEYMGKMPAQKQLLLIDACQSGGAVTTFSSRGAAEEKAIAQLGRSTGMVVLAATASDQFAYEFGKLGHGAFTYSVLKGLEGDADGGRQDGAITVNELKAFVEDLVPEMTQQLKGKAQYPNSYSSGQDFPLGTVKK